MRIVRVPEDVFPARDLRLALALRIGGEHFIDHLVKLALWTEKGPVAVVGEDDARDYCVHIVNILQAELSLDARLHLPTQPATPPPPGSLVLWCAEGDRADETRAWLSAGARLETLKRVVFGLIPVIRRLEGLRHAFSPRDVIRVVLGGDPEEARAAPLKLLQIVLHAAAQASGPVSLLGGGFGLPPLFRNRDSRDFLLPRQTDWTLTDPDDWDCALASCAHVGVAPPTLSDPRFPTRWAGRAPTRVCIDAINEGRGAIDALTWALEADQTLLCGRFALGGEAGPTRRRLVEIDAPVPALQGFSSAQAGRPAGEVLLPRTDALEQWASRHGRRFQILASVPLAFDDFSLPSQYAAILIESSQSPNA